MDDFEEAVEMGYLEKFLRQDHDMAETSQTIGEDELDKLMREMTDADLDSLVDHLSVDDVDEAELADLGASTPPSRTADLPSTSSSTSGLFSSTAAADASPTKSDAKSTPTTAADKGAGAAASPVKEKAEGLLASVGAAVSELGHKASEAVHAVEQKVEGLAAEPASVTAAKEELEEGTSPIKETRAEPPVESDSRTAADLVELDKKEVASPGPLPNEPTLDELIDTTLAKESIEAEKKDDEQAKADDEEGEKERQRLLAEAKKSEAAIHKADSAKAATSGPAQTAKVERDEEELAQEQEKAATEAGRKVEESLRAAEAKDEPTNEATLDSIIDKTMAKEHAEYEAKKAEAEKPAVPASDATHAAAESAKKTE